MSPCPQGSSADSPSLPEVLPVLSSFATGHQLFIQPIRRESVYKMWCSHMNNNSKVCLHSTVFTEINPWIELRSSLHSTQRLPHQEPVVIYLSWQVDIGNKMFLLIGSSPLWRCPALPGHLQACHRDLRAFPSAWWLSVPGDCGPFNGSYRWNVFLILYYCHQVRYILCCLHFWENLKSERSQLRGFGNWLVSQI